MALLVFPSPFFQWSFRGIFRQLPESAQLGPGSPGTPGPAPDRAKVAKAKAAPGSHRAQPKQGAGMPRALGTLSAIWLLGVGVMVWTLLMGSCKEGRAVGRRMPCNQALQLQVSPRVWAVLRSGPFAQGLLRVWDDWGRFQVDARVHAFQGPNKEYQEVSLPGTARLRFYKIVGEAFSKGRQPRPKPPTELSVAAIRTCGCPGASTKAFEAAQASPSPGRRLRRHVVRRVPCRQGAWLQRCGGSFCSCVRLQGWSRLSFRARPHVAASWGQSQPPKERPQF